MVYHHLYDRFAKTDLVRVGIIGAGNYGTAIVTQDPLTPRLRVTIIADISLENARGAYEKAGIPAAEYAYAATAAEAETLIADGLRVYTDRPEIVAQVGAVDIVAESTGVPEVSARMALDAIAAGKHVAMITKDCDVSVGPILKRKAQEAGVIYTPVDGDQHGLLMQMHAWAKTVGLTVISGGKATDGEFIWAPEVGTLTIHTDKKIKPPFVPQITVAEEDRQWLNPIPPGRVEEFLAHRARILAPLPQPGAYDLCEITVAANYTGLAPQVDTLYHAPLRITEVPEAYATTATGGLFHAPGAIDLVTCLRLPAESGLGGGVWLVVRADNAYSQHILATKGQIPNHDESSVVIYRPYHLCGVETSTTLLMAGLLGLDTGTDDYLPRFDLIKVARRDISKGEIFGNDHDPTLIARIIPAVPVAPGNLATAHLLTGNRAAVDIPAGTAITYDMVEEPAGSTIWALRREQDRTFLGA